MPSADEKRRDPQREREELEGSLPLPEGELRAHFGRPVGRFRGPVFAFIFGAVCLLVCGNRLVPLPRWHLLFGNSHEPVGTLAEVTDYTGIQFPSGTDLIDAETVDSLSSGSAIFARSSIPKKGFSAFSRDPRYQGLLRRGDERVREYSADLWPEVRARWNLPFTGSGLVGGRGFAEPGFIARETSSDYLVHLWEWH